MEFRRTHFAWRRSFGDGQRSVLPDSVARSYDTYSQRWLANILGTNAWGSSFIVGDGSTFPNCIQHQVANLAGALDGTSGGTPVLWGAASEGPGGYATSGCSMA